MNELLSGLLDLLFPRKCPFCGKLTDTDGVCGVCRAALPYRPEGQIMRTIGGFPCAVTFYYEDMVKDGIRALKFHRIPSRAAAFAPYLVQTAAEQLGGAFDAVTFVPVSPWRNFSRGFDQAQLLAEEAARLWEVRAEKTLLRVRNAPPQSSLKRPEERRANVLGAYRPRPGAAIQGRRFLLIDDVCTTGSTLAECARVLLDAGAASVVCAALAGGHRQTKTEK